MGDAGYMALYMRQYRRGDDAVAMAARQALEERRRRRQLKPLRDWSGLFKPLALIDQREGHCVFCGLRTSAEICALCRRELGS